MIWNHPIETTILKKTGCLEFLRKKCHGHSNHTIPWASTTMKIMVDPILMIKTLRLRNCGYINTHCLSGGWNPRVEMSWRSELVIIDSWWLWQLHPFQPFRLIWTVFFCGKTSGHQAFRWLQHIVEIHRLKNHGVSQLDEMCSTADCCRYCISNYFEWHMKYHHCQLLHRFQKGTHTIHAPHGSSPDPESILGWITWTLCFAHGILLIRSSVAGICIGTERCSVFSCRILEVVPYACRFFESAWMSQEVRINGL